ncbi:MAG: CZB domain-containing protein [Sideroxydans sp.]|nr:CZB domain-containing protein [Sideroxydans sp.]
MFSKIFSVFGLGQQEPEKEILQVINIYDAVLVHRAWKRRLIDYLEGRSQENLQPSKICVDNLCVLGKWIHSDGKAQFEDQAVFKKLMDEHAKFHIHAAKVVEAHQEGNDELAQSILTGNFDEQSRKTVVCLVKLHAMVEEEEQRLNPQ